MNELPNRFCFRAAIFFQLVALGILATVPAAAAAQSRATFQGVPVPPGKTISATVPLSAEEKTYAAIGGNRVPASAVATLVTPPGFDPGNSWPVLVVFSTSDSHRENRGDIPFYITEAMAEGWLVLTGDGAEPPREDSTGWRAAMTLAALDALHRSFPGSNKWPVACAGISGGAKRACLIAPLLAVKGNRVAGLYLAGVNEDLLGEGYRTFHPGSDFLNTMIFIIGGQSDKIATPAQTERVMRSIRVNGFRQVRLETFPEGHNVKRPLTVAALRWFHSGSSAALPEARMVAGSSVRMEAKETGSGAQKKIVVTFSDPSGKAGAIAAHVYFIGKAPNGGARFIYAHSDLSINLRGAAVASAKVNVVELKSDQPTKRAPAGFAYTGVGEMEGWIATAQENGKMFSVRASSPALRDVAQERSHDSLKAMVADYEKRTAEPAQRP
jgi:hypothetical protein